MCTSHTPQCVVGEGSRWVTQSWSSSHIKCFMRKSLSHTCTSRCVLGVGVMTIPIESSQVLTIQSNLWRISMIFFGELLGFKTGCTCWRASTYHEVIKAKTYVNSLALYSYKLRPNMKETRLHIFLHDSGK